MNKIYSFAMMLMVELVMLCACQPSLEDTVLELTDPDSEAYVYTCDRQAGDVQINCNRTWKASCSEPWLVLSETRGSAGDGQWIDFMLAGNEGYQYRDAVVTVTAGKAVLEIVVHQAPKIVYFVNENFDSSDLVLEASLPDGWSGDENTAFDVDGDGFGWRRWRDPATDLTYAYSCSYQEQLFRALRPDNWMVTPRFTVPEAGFSIRWDSKGSDAEYLGDKYEVYVASYRKGDTPELLKKLCEETTTSAETLTSHQFSMDDYVGERICIAFHHFDSYNLARVLITNVEVSNR